jgi:hypothetical protein
MKIASSLFGDRPPLMQLFFVAEPRPIGARSCHGAAPARILVPTRETLGMTAGIRYEPKVERDVSLFLARPRVSGALAGVGSGRFVNLSRG